ncbi:MAG: extracellular solute-binding protein [Patescibacteria group bacterium]|nr:extracellular solute-binding protein [Patescibacteria group bacterium]
MAFTKNQIIVIAAILGLILIVILVFSGIIPGLKPKPEVVRHYEANLEFWGIFDTPEAYSEAFQNFKNIYPGVTVRYQGFSDPEEYERNITEALAEGRGPDIFMIRNSALLNYLNKIASVPNNKFDIYKLKRLFPQIVEQDLSYQENIFALPTSIDTLALIYNKDLFNQAGIVYPPTTWEDFKEIIPKLAKRESTTKIIKAAAAIGGSEKTVSRAPDLLSLLMLQTGTEMVGKDLNSAKLSSQEGVNAMEFYTQFSNAAKESYTWNDTMPKDLNFFSEEKVAMIFNYESALPEIKNKNAFLNIAVAPMPQPKTAKKAITYANYWGYTVSKQSKYSDVAWDFIIELTTDEGNAKNYANATLKTPALLSLINLVANNESNPDASIFAKQALIAKSWPEIDPMAVSKIFSQAISYIITGQKNTIDALEQANNEIAQILKRRSR